MYYGSPGKILKELDKKAEQVRQSMIGASQAQVTDLWRHIDLSAIYHDWALEGQVVSLNELDGAFDSKAITDATSLPLYTSLRSHKRAFDYSREVASRKKLVFSLELFKEFHAFFASDPESAQNGRYRRDIPLHRSYFHEICDPKLVSTNMRKLIEWLNNSEEALILHPVKWVAKFHYRFMRIFPFIETTGKVGRATMNMVLIRQGYLPAIIHATERQRYYEAIRQSEDDLVMLIAESAMSSLDAAQKFLRHSALAS